MPNDFDTVDAALARLRDAGLPAHGWAYLAAEAVRALNHATFDAGAYTSPGEVYSVIVELQALTQRSPQALRQAGRALEVMDEAGYVVDVRRPQRTAVTVVAVTESLAHAAGTADTVARELSSAQQPAANLAYRDPAGAGER